MQSDSESFKMSTGIVGGDFEIRLYIDDGTTTNTVDDVSGELPALTLIDSISFSAEHKIFEAALIGEYISFDKTSYKPNEMIVIFTEGVPQEIRENAIVALYYDNWSNPGQAKDSLYLHLATDLGYIFFDTSSGAGEYEIRHILSSITLYVKLNPTFCLRKKISFSTVWVKSLQVLILYVSEFFLSYQLLRL